MHADDVRLVEALLAKDEAAYLSLVRRLHPRLVAITRRITGNDQAAEDAVQEAWGRVLAALPGFRGDSRLDTWIFQIAMNRARTRAARAPREVPVSAVADDDHDPLERAFNAIGRWRDRMPAWQPEGPEARAVDRQLARFVTEALDELPERQRLAVTLRDVEGVDATSAAAILAVSDEHLRVLLHRGRTRVRQIVAARMSGSAGEP